MAKNFTIGSLFDGSGGFPLAATMCGGTPVWASEVEPYPIAVTRSRFPNMKHLGDITKINGAEVEPVDIISFGSPCQDLSVAGKRAGLKHEDNGDEETTRSGLFMEAVRIIKEMRRATNGLYPRFAVWENVPGAFSSNKGEDFRIVCEELIKIVEPAAVMPAVPKNGWSYADSYCGEGWSLAYRVFDAQYWGVPQRRRRIYLVLDLRGECAGEILFEREGLRGYFTEGGSPWQGTAADAENSIGADDREGENADSVAYGWPLGFRPENVRVYEETATTICTGTRPGFTCGVVCCIDGDKIGKAERAGGSGLGIRQNDKMYTLTAKDAGQHGVVYAVDQGGGKSGANFYDNLSPTLTCTHGGEPAVAYGINGDIAGTLDASYYKGCGMRQGVEREVVAYCVGNGQLNQITMAEQANTLDCMHDQQAVIQPYQSVIGALCSTDYKWVQQQQVEQDKLIVEQHGDIAGVDCWNYTEADINGSLQASGGHNINSNNVVRVRYIVRRLTPTECARLQGFADRWAVPDRKDDFADEEYRFWCVVYLTKMMIDGKVIHNEDGDLIYKSNRKPYKDKTKHQMLKWYNNLWSDSSEYKLWGNGIAFPNALYVMQGIADALNQIDRRS